MSDEGEFAERWSVPRDAASARVPDDNDAATGPLSRPDEVEPGAEQPGRSVFPASAEESEYAGESHASYGTEPQAYGSEPQAYGTEPQAFTGWETPDPPDSLAEGRVVFSTPAPEDRLDFSLPDYDLPREDAAEPSAAEPVAPAEGRLEFSSSDYLTYDVSQAGAAEASAPEPAAPAEDRLGFSSSDYLTYDVSQAGASEASVPEPAAPAEDRLDFSSSSYLSYDSYDVQPSATAESSAEVPAEEPVAPAEGRLEFSSSSYLSYDSYDVSGDGTAEASAAEPVAPAKGRREFSAPDYLTYDTSPPAPAEVAAASDPPAPTEDRPASYSSPASYSADYSSGMSTPATSSASWEGSLFDGTADTEAGDERYVPAMPPGAGTPPKPGTPSSGNLRLPDWMREEGGYGRHAAPEAGRFEEDDDETGRSRFALFAVVALVVALVLAGSVYFLRSGGDEQAATPPAGAGEASTGAQPVAEPRLPARKALRRFPGTPSVAIGRFTDVHAGLSYPRFGTPWQAATKQNRLGQLGWSGQQVVVTEQRGSQLWYGQVLSGTLGPGEMSMYGGPGTEEATAAAYAKHAEERFYGFPHRSRPFASQPLTVSGHKGWLVSSYLRYRRPGIRATGELVVTAVVDTGRPSPAVLFMAIPNTHRRLWPDVNYFLTHLRVAG